MVYSLSGLTLDVVLDVRILLALRRPSSLTTVEEGETNIDYVQYYSAGTFNRMSLTISEGDLFLISNLKSNIFSYIGFLSSKSFCVSE